MNSSMQTGLKNCVFIILKKFLGCLVFWVILTKEVQLVITVFWIRGRVSGYKKDRT